MISLQYHYYVVRAAPANTDDKRQTPFRALLFGRACSPEPSRAEAALFADAAHACAMLFRAGYAAGMRRAPRASLRHDARAAQKIFSPPKSDIIS